MEGVLYSNSNDSVEKIAETIETLLAKHCRNIWIWCQSKSTFDTLVQEDWEEHIHFCYDKHINSIGDCLRDLYTRSDSRDNLLIIGDISRIPDKIIVHKNYSKKNVGTVLFANGNVDLRMKKGILDTYEWNGTAKARALDIAYCCPVILSLFYDNFDCETFHDLLLAYPIGVKFACIVDKRISFFDEEVDVEIEDEQDFIKDLEQMLADGTNVSKLELNGCRLAYGKMFSELADALHTLGRSDLVDIFNS